MPWRFLTWAGVVVGIFAVWWMVGWLAEWWLKGSLGSNPSKPPLDKPKD